ncbi:MAG: type I methionyl aminopeptidase [Firmicutes bacterium]|nr:type I methionyl aminopeptidase [Bacillota bacterium]
MITIKTEHELELMRHAGKILKDALELVRERAKEGVTTKRLDTLAYNYIKTQNAHPTCLGYDKYPASICTSINEEVIHGIPSEKRVLEEGMLLKVDICVNYKGFNADGARTFTIGKVSPEKLRLKEVAEESFFEGIKFLKEGARLGEYSSAVQAYVEKHGMNVIRDFVGHGIGRDLHEDPSVPNFGVRHKGVRLTKNMTLAVEPMISLGGFRVQKLADGWTMATEDKSPSAHYENTVIITNGLPEIITL